MEIDLVSDDSVSLLVLVGGIIRRAFKKIFSKWWFQIGLMMSCAKTWECTHTVEQLRPDSKRQKLDEKPIIVH